MMNSRNSIYFQFFSACYFVENVYNNCVEVCKIIGKPLQIGIYA